MMKTPPILFLIFNRPDLTARVFSAIREAKPAQLFVAADGHRTDRDGEESVCMAVRDSVLQNIDWECEVFTLFRDQNLGCKKAVSSAISWFFEHVEEGIILEDDCVPSLSFFGFCQELLERYKNDERVSFISGTCLPGSGDHVRESYYFSKFSIIWGWATWRRVWQHYDAEMPEWGGLADTNWLTNAFYGNAYFAKGFRNMFDAIYRGYDTWDFQFFFLNLKNNSLNIHPSKNMIKNIGFGAQATHTHSVQPYSNTETYEIDELVHPLSFAFDYQSDMQIFELLYKYETNIPFYRKVKNKVKVVLKTILNRNDEKAL